MKPNWEDAPEWAQWLAMDKNGRWAWYSIHPIFLDTMWTTNSGRMEIASLPDSVWLKSLERRPE